MNPPSCAISTHSKLQLMRIGLFSIVGHLSRMLERLPGAAQGGDIKTPDPRLFYNNIYGGTEMNQREQQL